MTLAANAARAAADNPSPATAPASSTSRVRQVGAGTLEDRVAVFTRSLNLDPGQQAQLRKILTEQRETVRRIWSDKGLLPAERAPATRAANERTGDRIRAMLNDEQKKKYNPPQPANPRDSGDQPSVEQWLEKSRQK